MENFGEHPETATAEHDLALVLMSLHRNEEALKLLESSLKIKETYFGKTSKKAANTLDTIGRCLMEMNRLEEAEEAGRKCNAIRQIYIDNPNHVPKVK